MNMADQPAWFKELKQQGKPGNVAAPKDAPKGSTEDRVTALEQLLEKHGIRPQD
jgi:hypothetical protein